MKRKILLGLALLCLPGLAYADHALPQGNNTFYLAVNRGDLTSP